METKQDVTTEVIKSKKIMGQTLIIFSDFGLVSDILSFPHTIMCADNQGDICKMSSWYF